jgi:hypothetical protein
MVDGKIHVDQDELNAQIKNLQALVDDAAYVNYCANVLSPVLDRSAGDAVAKIKGADVNGKLDAIVDKMYAIIRHTVGALGDVSLVEADEGLARQFASGTVTASR